MDKPVICTWCEASVTDLRAVFCPVCGANLNAAGRVPEMKYKHIDLNENGKALVCPHCENEELTQGDYCKICGNSIINRCADTPNAKSRNLIVRACGSILQGNARYCSKCGNESSFYQKGWLKDWRTENTKKAIRNVNSGDNTITFKEIKSEKTT